MFINPYMKAQKNPIKNNAIIIIPIILCISVSGIKLYQSIMKDRRKENIKLEVVKHTIVSVLNIVVLIIAAFVEAYVSTSIVELVIKYF